MRKLLAALVLLATAPAALAHPLAPALLQLKETAPQRYDVLWRTSVAQVAGREVAPELPATCTPAGPAERRIDDNEALEARWAVQCTGLAGESIAIRGLERSGINVVLRIEDAQGRVTSTLLDAQRASFEVPQRATRAQVFGDYASLGVRHLLSGADHLLFVLGLLLLVRGVRPLVVTVTAFTLGHSLTLAAATLGFVRINPALTELGIALSLVCVAAAILQPGAKPGLLQRRPALITLAFGLLHGLGFAGALARIGLPADELPLSLLAFNLGIEAGQLLVIAAGLGLAALARRLVPLPALARTPLVPAYIIGSLAACWCIERTIVLLA